MPLIVADVRVANGRQAYVEGTGLSVGLILIHLAGGESEERILDEFSRRARPLSRRGLRAAVAYGAALAREEELSPPAAAALGE
ncbi:MAG TPA: DUF433 domain-containing protein, partial [Egibacteraceae bacterium]|nr:DUF433 domain-containing protein [Egibacteraceae bacterium]